MANQKPETVFDIESLFVQINDSFTSAALQLRQTFDGADWKQSPFVYHMPKMHLTMKLSLSHSNGKVKGVFRKTSTQHEEAMDSTIEVDVVAVPNPRIPGQAD